MEGIIFQNLIDRFNKTSLNINSFFENQNFNETDIFNIIDKLPKYYIILYILIVFFIFNFISKMEIRLNAILTFLVSVLILYFLIRSNFYQFSNYTKEKQLQLDFLHKLIFDENFTYNLKNDFIIKPKIEKTYLFMDPLIIEFFYRIREYSQYNISSFVKSLLHCNNILGIMYEAQIGLNRKYLNYETAIFEVKNALNELNSVIYNTPLTEISLDKFKNSITSLHRLLNHHIKDLGNFFKIYNKTEDLNLYKMPDNFYDEYFVISHNDTKTKDYQSAYNMY
jgi:hypothetical protein